MINYSSFCPPAYPNPNAMFYSATIQTPSAITKAIKCRFTYQQSTPSSPDQKSSFDLDHNLVTVSSNVLKVYRMTQNKLDLALNSQFNDRILDIISVRALSPQKAAQMLHQQNQNDKNKKRRTREIEEANDLLANLESVEPVQEKPLADYLFILTQNFHCSLLWYNPYLGRLEVISKGELADRGAGERRKTPKIMVAPDSKYLVLFLYENQIKIVPICPHNPAKDPQPGQITPTAQLSSTMNVRVRHSDIFDICLLNSGEFTILYQRMDHGTEPGTGLPTKRMCREIDYYSFDMQKRDELLPMQPSKILFFKTATAYKLQDLWFGGFLVFDIDTIMYVSRSNLSQPKWTHKLRGCSPITAISPVDLPDQSKPLVFVRFLIATENGDLSMIGFNFQQGCLIQEPVSMVVEFLGSNLSIASSVVYLDSSLIFYGAQASNSYILKVTPDRQDQDPLRPYIQVVETYDSLSPIVSLEMASRKDTAQQELLVTSGLNSSTFLTLIKKGVQLNQQQDLTSELGLDPQMVEKIDTCQEYVFIKLHSIEGIFVLKYDQDEYVGVDQQIVLNGELLGIVSNQVVKEPKQQNQNDVEGMEIDMENTPEVQFMVITTKQIQVLNQNFEQISSLDQEIQLFSYESPLLAISNDKSLQVYQTQPCLTKLHDIPQTSAITAIDLQYQVLSVALNDFPFHSLRSFKISDTSNNSDDLQPPILIHQTPLATHLSLSSLNKFFAQSTSNFQQPDNQPCLSLKLFQLDQTNESLQAICAFGNGKVLQIALNNDQTGDIEEQARQMSERWANLDFNTQSLVFHVSVGLPKLQRMQVGQIGNNQDALEAGSNHVVVAASDKPAVFYQSKGALQLQYLAGCDSLIQVCQSQPGQMVYLTKTGLQIGVLEPIQKLQMSRMMFKKSISKSMLITEMDLVVVLLEQPDQAYIDPNRTEVNMVATVSRTGFQVKNTFDLDRHEIANCVEKTPINPNELLVGTCYVYLNESVPSQGRFLVFNLDDGNSLTVTKQMKLAGSIQAISWEKHLVLGVNNRIEVYSDSQQLYMLQKQPVGSQQTNSNTGNFSLVDYKTTGTFIHSIKALTPNSIVVADLAASGLATFDLKEQRQQKIKIVESAATHQPLWINSVIPISESEFVVFDQDQCFYVFKKNLEPTSLEEKYKLKLECWCNLQEEVTCATFGSLAYNNKNQNSSSCGQNGVFQVQNNTVPPVYGKSKNKSKKDSQSQPNQTNNDQQHMMEVDQEEQTQKTINLTQIQEDQTVDLNKFCTDQVYAIAVVQKAIFSVENNVYQQLVYGTADGTLGTLFKIQPLVYSLLEIIQRVMDKGIGYDVLQKRRSDYRSVKNMQSTVIDGNYVQIWSTMSKNRQIEVCKKITTTTISSSNNTAGVQNSGQMQRDEESLCQQICILLDRLKQLH